MRPTISVTSRVASFTFAGNVPCIEKFPLFGLGINCISVADMDTCFTLSSLIVMTNVLLVPELWQGLLLITTQVIEAVAATVSPMVKIGSVAPGTAMPLTSHWYVGLVAFDTIAIKVSIAPIAMPDPDETDDIVTIGMMAESTVKPTV